MNQNNFPHLLEFLETTDIKQTSIFPHLKCNITEAKILQNMTKEYLRGSAESGIYELLTTDKKSGFSYIKKIQLIKKLLDLGWIIIHSYSTVRPSEISLLELLHQSVGLSSSFLKLLENGTLDVELPEIKPYTDQLQYLQEQFKRVEVYQQLLTIRQSYDKDSPGFKRLKTRLVMLESQIAQRVNISTIALKVEELFKEKNLNEQEKIIFLTLLREEYSATDESFRDMNVLIELVSFDDYEKIKNRSLLEDTSTLLEKLIIDYDEVLNPFGGIGRSFFIQDDVLADILYSKKEKKKEKIKLDALIKEQDIFELVIPKTTLEDVVLNIKTKEMIDLVMKQMDKTVSTRLKDWGIKDKKSTIEAKILFHGYPGTGKTLTAVSMAKSLKKQIVSFDCSKILSMYIGESEKNVRKIFDDYYEIVKKTKSHPVLLLNEADQFLSSRTTASLSSADKMHNQMQNIFLEQIEKFDGILIATTNLLDTFDQAFSRRFNYKIKFEKPNFQQRVLLWQKMMPKNAPLSSDLDIQKLASYDLTGGQINLIIKNTAFKVATKEDPVFNQDDFIDDIKKEISGTFGDEKNMGFLS